MTSYRRQIEGAKVAKHCGSGDLLQSHFRSGRSQGKRYHAVLFLKVGVKPTPDVLITRLLATGTEFRVCPACSRMAIQVRNRDRQGVGKRRQRCFRNDRVS
jgi:hypothetical protein